MVVGASSDKRVAPGDQLLRHSLSIVKDLLLVKLELRGFHLFHVGGDSANFLIVWSTLKAWENSIVNLLGKVAFVLSCED